MLVVSCSSANIHAGLAFSRLHFGISLVGCHYESTGADTSPNFDVRAVDVWQGWRRRGLPEIRRCRSIFVAGED